MFSYTNSPGRDRDSTRRQPSGRGLVISSSRCNTLVGVTVMSATDDCCLLLNAARAFLFFSASSYNKKESDTMKRFISTDRFLLVFGRSGRLSGEPGLTLTRDRVFIDHLAWSSNKTMQVYMWAGNLAWSAIRRESSPQEVPGRLRQPFALALRLVVWRGRRYSWP